MEAFTHSLLLTAVPRRSDADCDKIDAMPTGHKAVLGAAFFLLRSRPKSGGAIQVW